jgi:hypothetical protein
MATDIDLKLIEKTITEINTSLTTGKISIGSTENDYGFAPLIYYDSVHSTKLQGAVLDENAGFLDVLVDGELTIKKDVIKKDNLDTYIRISDGTPPEYSFVSDGVTKLFLGADIIIGGGANPCDVKINLDADNFLEIEEIIDSAIDSLVCCAKVNYCVGTTSGEGLIPIYGIPT